MGQTHNITMYHKINQFPYHYLLIFMLLFSWYKKLCQFLIFDIIKQLTFVKEILQTFFFLFVFIVLFIAGEKKPVLLKTFLLEIETKRNKLLEYVLILLFYFIYLFIIFYVRVVRAVRKLFKTPSYVHLIVLLW